MSSNIRNIVSGFLVSSCAALVQWVFWDFLHPFVWILFYPAAFIAASLGGVLGAVACGIFSITYVYFLFVEPRFLISYDKLNALHTALVFIPFTYVFGKFSDNYKKLKSDLEKQLREAEVGRDQAIYKYESSLNLREIRFVDFAGSLPQIVWATDASGKNIYFNESWMNYTGMSLAESLGDGWNKPFHPDDRHRAWDAWRNATVNLAEYALECRLRKSDGSYRWWLIRGVPVKNSAGKILNWFGTCTDIHTIKQTLDDLQVVKDRLQSVFDNSPGGLAIIMPDGRYSIFNERFFSYFGYKDAPSMPLNHWQLMDQFEVRDLKGQAMTTAWLPVMKALKEGVSLVSELCLIDKNSRRKWYGNHSARPIKRTNDGITGVVLSVHNITEKVERDLQLSTLLADQNLILNNGIAGVSKTIGRHFVWVNDVFANNLGYQKDELIGKPGHIIYPNDQAFDAFGKKIASIQNAERPLLRDALWLKKKDGSLAWFLVGGGPVKAGSDEAIWLSIDMTQDKKNQELLEAYLKRIEKSMTDTLLVLSKTVEVHDPYTAGHQFRVGHIAQEIGRVMGLPAHQLENLRLMGLIHDIGKIGVPAEILSKPGVLSAEEMALVRAHTKIGYDILSNVNFDIPVAQVAYQHHERVDGSGYPRALKASQILLESRIIAVADVMEAMSSHRPYRPSLGLGIALEEVRAGRGTKYDPEVVDACLKLFNENGYSLDGSYQKKSPHVN